MIPLADHAPPVLAASFQPNSAGYLGYIDPKDNRAARRHINHEAIAWQPLALLYNRPAHCHGLALYERLMAVERDFAGRYGEYERRSGDAPLRDSQLRGEQARFRTLRAPVHYRFAPTRKLFGEGPCYNLWAVLNDCGHLRSLDGTEETQHIVIFSAMDPATPIGFFLFHRRVERRDKRLKLSLYPNFIYVSPPCRGLGYGIALVSATLEIWENELHYQAARYRSACAMDVQIDADAIVLGDGRPILGYLRRSTAAAMESCASYWGCEMTPLRVVETPG